MHWSEHAGLRRWVLRQRGGFFYRVFDRCADRLLGMETRRVVDPENFGFSPAEASSYVPSDWWSISAVLRALPVDSNHIFLDLGCGKGRVMRLALNRPFSRVVGVELLPKVAEFARLNLRSQPRAQVITGDARSVDFPSDGPLWVFLFQPFSWGITESIIHRLPSCRVIYHSPIFHDLIMANGRATDETSMFIPMELQREYRVYRLG